MGTRSRKRYLRFACTTDGSNDGVTPGPTIYQQRTGNFSDWRDDGSPNIKWRKLIKDGRSATTLLSGERIWTDIEPCTVKLVREFKLGTVQSPYYRSYPTKFQGNPPGTWEISDPGTPTIDFSKANSEASKKFYQKVKGLQQSFSGMQWAGELRQTIRMLRNPAANLFRSARDDYLKRVKRMKGGYVRNPNWAAGLSGAYLEWFYGVRPLVMDIEDALDTIDYLSEEKVIRRRISGSYNQKGSPTVNYNGADADMYYGLAFNLRKITCEYAKVRYIGLWQLERARIGKSWTIGDKAKQLGFTLENFVPTVWELLPWSFLVDYFTTVGDVLDTTFTSLDDVKWINKTIRTVKEIRRESTPNLARMKQLSPGGNSPKLLSVDVNRLAFSEVRRIKFNRLVESPQPVALAFEVPSSPLKWLAMGALAHQANAIHPQKYLQAGTSPRRRGPKWRLPRNF